MRSLPTEIDGVVLIEPLVHGDERGFFHESFREDALATLGLADQRFPQENHSRSSRGVLRGLHFQIGAGIGKLVRCARGAIYDVVVDLRRGSPSYGGWAGFELDDRELRQLWVPPGFAHGFYTLSELADVLYKQTGYYDPSLERTIAWNDPRIDIHWPLSGEPIVSQRDAAAPTLSEIEAELPFRYASGD
jgi:dTDP-4-dehydrorhamnose 3,5-epimerase